ncbi:MAG: YncE family protein [Pseudomonadota bacterium]|nr:YncE family protein [Pseudomonadota bacterium]
MMRRRAWLGSALAGAAAAAWGAAPSAPAQAGAGPLAYITNQGSHNVSVLDVRAARVLTTIAVGKEPAGVVAVPARREVFVANAGAGTLSVIDARVQAVVAEISVGAGGAVGIDASADGRWVYVADWFGAQLLTVSAAQRRIQQRTPLGPAPAGVAADGALVWVAERDDNRVALLDPQAGRVLARVAVGEHPFGLLLDAPRQRLYVLNVYSNDVSVIDTTRRRVTATLPCGESPYGAALADGGQRLYVTNQRGDSLSVWQAGSLKPLPGIDGLGYPEGIAATGDTLVAVNWMDDDASLMDARTGAERVRVPVGKNPRAFGHFILPPPKG